MSLEPSFHTFSMGYPQILNVCIRYF